MRNYAEPVKNISPEGARALVDLQDQIDALVLALKSKIKVTVSANAGAPSVRTANVYPWATKDPATPQATGELYRHPTFGLREQQLQDANGGIKPQLRISGRGIVNVFSATTVPPVVTLATSPTGGTLPGGVTYTVGCWAVGSDGLWTAMGLASIVVPSGTNTNTVAVTVAFADAVHDSGWVAITPIQDAGWYGPNAQAIAIGGTSYTFTSIGDLNTPVPDENFDHFVLQARTASKLGVWGMNIVAVAGAKITFPPDCAFTVNQFAGRTMGILRKNDPTQRLPLAEVLIVSNDATSVTASESLAALGVVIGDEAFCVMQATTHTSHSIGDANCVNGATGGQASVGMPVNGYVGQLVMITRGTGSGTIPVPVASNSATVLTTTVPFVVTPDATSEFIVINSVVDFQAISGQIEFDSSTADDGVDLPLLIDNTWRHYFVQVLTATGAGATSLVQYSPFRYIFHLGLSSVLASEKWTVGFLPGGLPGDIPAGPPPAGTSELTIIETDGTPYKWEALAEIGPVGADIIIDILYFRGVAAGVSIFGTGTKIVIPDGTTNRTIVVSGTLTDPKALQIGDRLQLSVIQVGLVTAGQRARVELFWSKTVQNAASQ